MAVPHHGLIIHFVLATVVETAEQIYIQVVADFMETAWYNIHYLFKKKKKIN